jgi:Flp pilus assembly pilin Flp
MTVLHRIAAEGQTRLHAVRENLENRESGQGTLEYVGIAVLIGVIMTALFASGIDEKIKQGVLDAFDKITKGK